MKKILYIFVLCFLLYADDFRSVKILKLDKPTFKIENESDKPYAEAIKNACNAQITQYFYKENIIKFFQFAKEYDSYQAATYCYFPCKITGKINLNSKIYDFELNEGGFAVLKNKKEKRYFGDEKLYGECGI